MSSNSAQFVKILVKKLLQRRIFWFYFYFLIRILIGSWISEFCSCSSPLLFNFEDFWRNHMPFLDFHFLDKSVSITVKADFSFLFFFLISVEWIWKNGMVENLSSVVEYVVLYYVKCVFIWIDRIAVNALLIRNIQFDRWGLVVFHIHKVWFYMFFECLVCQSLYQRSCYDKTVGKLHDKKFC